MLTPAEQNRGQVLTVGGGSYTNRITGQPRDVLRRGIYASAVLKLSVRHFCVDVSRNPHGVDRPQSVVKRVRVTSTAAHEGAGETRSKANHTHLLYCM
ncbi:hypothetical protein EVAR_5689_1 [Eumeta japonica]|uniref:Uncharacterized protein n=1 Tax=Eumeta variegata TaxID=151549 RepID=A0A4C1TA72_EUMVA|nr:hypothetical protein EVAR_5689_1 [Eumeta japonica]